MDLIFKLSYHFFQTDKLISTYAKRYWNILSHRVTYISRKRSNIDILGLLPKIREDFLKIIEIYNIIPICNDILPVMIKILCYCYKGKYSMMLNNLFIDIFNKLNRRSDLDAVKASSDVDCHEIYLKLNDCILMVIENSLGLNFKDSAISHCVKFAIGLLKHKDDLTNCLRQYYLNYYTKIFPANVNSDSLKKVICTFTKICELSEKKFSKAMSLTYPYLGSIFRTHINYAIENYDKTKCLEMFPLELASNYLEICQMLIKKMSTTKQIVECDNCEKETGYHDSLKLSFSLKSYINICCKYEIDISRIMPKFLEILEEEKSIIRNLKMLPCANIALYEKKYQVDINNMAISVFEMKSYDNAANLFDFYITNQLKEPDFDQISLCRAAHNKSICEIDSKHSEKGVRSSMLSLLLAEQSTRSDKYMSLIISAKFQALKSEEPNATVVQMTVLDFAREYIEMDSYKNIKHILGKIDFR